MIKREATLPRQLGGRQVMGRFLVLSGMLLLARMAGAGDLADVKARGKLVMLCYPSQNSVFVSPDIDAMREHNLKLAELRHPDHFRGLDVELVRGFAKSLGVELEIHPVTTGYDALLPALVNHQGDLVASSLTVTPKRQEVADFSAPYLKSWVVVAAPFSSKLASLEELAGRKGALMRGSSQLEFLQTVAPDVKILLTDFSLENYAAVKDGEADFTLMDSRSPPGQKVSAAYPELKVAFRLREFGYAMAVRKGSDLLAQLNSYLADLEESGDLERLTERHNPDKPQPPRP